MARWSVNVGVLLVATLTGCAGPAPSGGPGTTPLTQEQRAKALQRASAYCKKKGLVMRVDGAQTPTRSAQAASEVQFRCVKAG